MDLRVAARDVIESKGGIAKSADFVAAGIRAVDVVNMCNAGYLNRVRHGYYQMAEQNEVPGEEKQEERLGDCLNSIPMTME